MQQKTNPDNLDKTDDGKTKNRWVKFGLGALAGFVGFQFPRFIVLITAFSSGGYKGTNWTEEGIYLGLVIGVAVLMGFLVMLTQRETAMSPRETFFIALALPSLLGGAFHASEGAYQTNLEIDKGLKEGKIEIIDEAANEVDGAIEVKESPQFYFYTEENGEEIELILIEGEEGENLLVKVEKKSKTEKGKKEEPADK